MALVAKNPSAHAGNVRDMGLIPGLGRFPGKGNGNPLQYSCLENPMDRGTWQATVHRVTQSQTQLKLAHTYCSSGNSYSLWELLLNSHWILACLGESMECILLKQHASRPTRDILNPSWSVYTENRPPQDHKYSLSVLYHRWSQSLQPVGFIFLRDCYHSWIMIRQ